MQTLIMGKVADNRRSFPCIVKVEGLNTQLEYCWTSILRLIYLADVRLKYVYLVRGLTIVFPP